MIRQLCEVRNEAVKVVFLFLGAAVTKYHKHLGGLSSRYLFSLSSGGQKFEIQVLAVLVPSGGCEGESLPHLSLGSFWCFLA